MNQPELVALRKKYNLDSSKMSKKYLKIRQSKTYKEYYLCKKNIHIKGD